MSPRWQRSARESNPTFVLTKDACCHSTYRPVIPDGIEPSLSWMSPRSLGRWTTGSRKAAEHGRSQVADPGIEPGLQPYESRLSASSSAAVTRAGIEPAPASLRD